MVEIPNEQKQDVEMGQLCIATETDPVRSTLNMDPLQTVDAREPDDASASKIQTRANLNTADNENGDIADDSPPSFPKAFYCPITGKILEDPVAVAPDGISYERSALGDDVPADMLYYNRSLKSIIDETVEYKTSSGLKRLQQSVRHLIASPVFHRPLPDGYYCPITLNLIHVPVLDPEGYTYEKMAIENWIRHNGASPVTRRPLAIDELVPNRTLAVLMEEEKAKGEDLMHPTFKQWKEEPVPETTGDIQSGSVHGSTTVHTLPFPTTPEELAAANRRRRIRHSLQCHIWTIVVIVLAMLAWMVPVLATVLLVITLTGVAIVAVRSSSNDSFSPN